MALIHLVYVSTATDHVSRQDLEALVQTSAMNNAARAVTGLLLFSSGHFIQLLEGQQATVERLFHRIREDPRHKDVQLLLNEPIRDRSFSLWSMGLLDLDQHRDLDRSKLQYVIAPRGDDSEEAGRKAVVLLRAFRKLLPDPNARGTEQRRNAS